MGVAISLSVPVFWLVYVKCAWPSRSVVSTPVVPLLGPLTTSNFTLAFCAGSVCGEPPSGSQFSVCRMTVAVSVWLTPTGFVAVFGLRIVKYEVLICRA